MSKETILVTGGAGYIGSHVVQYLLDRGESVVVIDNLSTGDIRSVAGKSAILADICDINRISEIFEAYKIEAVMHFAASSSVPESVVHPLKYYSNNTAATTILMNLCSKYNVKHFIFSSTAAVYSNCISKDGVVSEYDPTNPRRLTAILSC